MITSFAVAKPYDFSKLPTHLEEQLYAMRYLVSLGTPLACGRCGRSFGQRKATRKYQGAEALVLNLRPFLDFPQVVMLQIFDFDVLAMAISKMFYRDALERNRGHYLLRRVLHRALLAMCRSLFICVYFSTLIYPHKQR